MGNYYGIVWSYGDQDSLSHYGIKGQRWGIRRFQYENGSYTPEGKERYRQNGSVANLKSASKDYIDLSLMPIGNNKKRAEEAARLGLKALKKMGIESIDENDMDEKEWFLYEDQTVGLPVIADLVNRGYSSQQISALIDEAANADANAYDDKKSEDLAFYLRETLYEDEGKKFAKACEEVKFPYGKTKYSDLPIIERLKKVDAGDSDDDDISNESGNINNLIEDIVKRKNLIASLDSVYSTKEYRKWEEDFDKAYSLARSKYGSNQNKIDESIAPLYRKEDLIVSSYRSKAIQDICEELGIPKSKRDEDIQRIIGWYINYVV